MNVKICTVIASLALCALPALAEELYFPETDGHWETIDPESIGWDQALLAEALEVAGERHSSGVLILHNGRILAERYWAEPDTSTFYQNVFQGLDSEGHAIEDVASAQKNITSVLVGMAQARGFLSLDDSVTSHLGTGWSKADASQERDIKILHLLSMTSGLAADLSYQAEPGSVWLYNTPAYHFLMRVVSVATGKDRETLTREWLTAPLSMAHSSWTPRPWASADIAVGFSTTARELARFGLMIQAGGRWRDEVVFEDADFIETMMRPSQALNPSYGYLWWLNGQAFSRGVSADAQKLEGQLIPAAPADLVAMQGAGDRKLYLVPSLNLIITRLGAPGAKDGESFNDAFWKALMKAKK